MFDRIKAVIAAGTAVVLSGTAASAGGLANEILEAPVVVEEPVEVAPASSVPGWVIPVAILAVLIGVASSSDGDGKKKKMIIPENF